MSPLEQILLTLGQVGAQGGAALGNAMQAQSNPLAFQQASEAQRQHEALLAQLPSRMG